MNETALPLADELASLAARMSPLLLSADRVTAAVEVLTGLAEEIIAAAAGAGVSLMDDQGMRTSTAATSSVVLEADDLQYRLNEGPCLTSWAQRRTVRVDDIGSDSRWPLWSEAVQPLRLLSSLSSPLVVGERALGAVKVYSQRRSAFDDHAERLLEDFAGTAALLLGNTASIDNGRALSENLQQAVKARDAVQLAKGIVMHRDGLTENAAFDVMVQEARTGERELREVADRIIRTVTVQQH